MASNEKPTRKKHRYPPMKKLYLVANTPVDKLEEIIVKVLKRYTKKSGEEAHHTVEFGRAASERQMHLRHAKVVIMLNPDTYKVNQDLINRDAVGFIISNAMTLNCITGRCVERWDFEPTDNGLKYTLRQPDPASAVTKVTKALLDGEATGRVSIESLRYVPTIINATGNNVSTFVQILMALTYNVKNELNREKFRSAFIHWIPTSDSTKVLKEQLKEIGEWRRSDRLDSFVKVFDDNKHLRPALASIYRGVYADKTSIKGRVMPDLAKLAENAKVGLYDLNYILGIMRKKPLSQKEISALEVHRARVAARYVDDTLDETSVDRDMEAIIDAAIEEGVEEDV